MSQRRVTGDALSRILTVGKTYIDNHDLGFEEVEIDDVTGNIVFCKCNELYREDVIDLLNRNFYKTPDNTEKNIK